MIKSFKCKETEKIYNRYISRKWSVFIQKSAMRKLWMINASENIADLRIPPGNRLETMKGQKNIYSIRINKQWRICFKWDKNDAYNVEITDYH